MSSYVYIINPFHCNFVKIGKWSQSLPKLQTRYQTYYGKTIDVYAYMVKNNTETENILKDILKDYTLDPRCELLKKLYLSYYQEIFKKICNTDFIKIKRKLNTKIICINKILYKKIIHQKLLKIFDIDDLQNMSGKKLTKEELQSHFDDIIFLENIGVKGNIIRSYRGGKDKDVWTIATYSKTLWRIMSLFNMSFKKEKRRQRRRIDKKRIDVSDYYFQQI